MFLYIHKGIVTIDEPKPLTIYQFEYIDHTCCKPSVTGNAMNQCREWNTYPTQKQQIYQPVDIQSDMIDKECDYPCNRYQTDYGQDWHEETRNGTMYGYDDLNEERFENLLSRYDEQDFPSDLTEIQLRNKHELTKATGEFDDYRELYNAERYQYYDSNQQFIHPRKHDSFAPNDQYCSQENDSNQYL